MLWTSTNNFSYVRSRINIRYYIAQSQSWWTRIYSTTNFIRCVYKSKQIVPGFTFFFFKDDINLASNIQWGVALKICDLPPPVMLKLCGLLDPPEQHGRDWCLLALRLGLCQEKIAALDSQHSSHTMRLLTSADCSIGNFNINSRKKEKLIPFYSLLGALISSLHELDRLDAAEVLLRSAPIFKILQHVSF